MDILTYGQKELKDVITQLEEQLKTVIVPCSQSDNYRQSKKKLPKSETKLNDSDIHSHSKKQRVDKNKCRNCKLSTIPTILQLLQQNETNDVNSITTMKTIRQQIAQRSSKKQEQSDSKIPYISFDYSHQIVICKRCRFKFHSECVQLKEITNEWICDYCLNRIEQLKNSNQWDYKNQKQLKQLPNLTSEQKKLNLKILERIQNKQTIFIISEFKPSPNNQISQITEFLQRYPLYKSDIENIYYPVSEILAADYPEVLKTTQKPKPFMIKSNMVEEIMKIQTIYQIMQLNQKGPENYTQEQIERNFYEILINIISVYFDEFIRQDDQKFQFYYDQANAHTASYLFIMNFLLADYKDNASELIKKSWKECVIQIDQVINYNSESQINQIDFNSLQFEDQILILKILSEGLYDLDKMKDLIKQKESKINKGCQNTVNLDQASFKLLFQLNQQIFINGGLYLGQDAQGQQYFYFIFFPSTVFVETKKGWGQFTISDLSDLMNRLNQQGVNELDLFKNLDIIKQIQLFDLSTPVKQKNKIKQKQEYQLDILEVIEKFQITEESYTQFLSQKSLYWIDDHEKTQFLSLMKNQDNLQQIISALKQFLLGLIKLKSKNGVLVEPFKIFKFHFVLVNQLAIYVENADSLSHIYISLLILEKILNERVLYHKQKQQIKIVVEKAKSRKVLKEEQKKSKKIQMQMKEEECQVESEKSKLNQSNKTIKNIKEKVQPTNNGFRVISCYSCLQKFSDLDPKVECTMCQKVFHKECLQKNKSMCEKCLKIKCNKKK